MGEQPVEDVGPEFDGIRIGRPAAGALLRAGYRTILDLPEDLDDLLRLHGVGPKAVRLVRAARTIETIGGLLESGADRPSHRSSS